MPVAVASMMKAYAPENGAQKLAQSAKTPNDPMHSERPQSMKAEMRNAFIARAS